MSRQITVTRSFLAAIAAVSLLGACTPETSSSAPAPATAAASSARPSASASEAPVAADAADLPATVSTSPSDGSAAEAAATAAGSPAPAPSSAAAVKNPAAAAAGLGALYAVAGITDGDTIKVMVGGTKEKVRIIGLDTPETKDPRKPVQCFGKEASSKMQSLVQSKQVHLQADPSQADRDRYGRLLRRVVLPDGTDVALTMIREGYAHEYTYDLPYRDQAAYKSAESQARTARRGLWATAACAAGAPVAGGGSPAKAAPSSAPAPRQQPAPTPPKAAVQPAGSCKIKGNISSSGEKIFHVPGQMAYDRTVITTSKGERWFCSAAEAQAAGWRAAKR